MEFRINGRVRRADVDMRTSLLDLLRDHLGLAGSKKGCDQEACGACTVLWADIADPQASPGARGIGEIGITGVAAAIANAVFNATGRRMRDRPITLDTRLPARCP